MVERIVIAVIFVISLLIIVAMVISSCSPTLELIKKDWTCTKSHSEHSTIFINGGGGVLMPMTTNNTVCDEWRRNQ